MARAPGRLLLNLDLPTSPYSPYISLYLPTPPYISLYLVGLLLYLDLLELGELAAAGLQVQPPRGAAAGL